MALSEYGGIAWPMPGHEAPGKTYYGTAKSRADLTARCKKLQLGTVLPQLKKDSRRWCTQLTDVEDEVNGLFTYDRRDQAGCQCRPLGECCPCRRVRKSDAVKEKLPQSSRSDD